MERFVAILIHLIIPIAGMVGFVLICWQMRKASIQNAPYFQLFSLFFGFGGWLLIFLTLCFWYWSGMATLGFFFLLLILPIVVFGCALSIFENRNSSQYHLFTLYGSFAYLLFTVACWVYLLFGSK
jgi:hypothetical protein